MCIGIESFVRNCNVYLYLYPYLFIYMCVLCIYLNQKLYHIVSSTTAVLIVCVYWNREFYTSILVYLYTQVYRSIPNVYTSIHLCMYYINVYTWMIPVSYFLFCLIIALCVLTVLNFLCISFYLYFFFNISAKCLKWDQSTMAWNLRAICQLSTTVWSERSNLKQSEAVQWNQNHLHWLTLVTLLILGNNW